MARPLRNFGFWTRSLLLTAAILVVFPAYATGYERTRTCEPSGIYECKTGQSPKPIYWPVRCIQYRINERGSGDFGDDETDGIQPHVRGYVRESFESWNEPECSDLQLVEGELTSNTAAEFDESASWSENMNLVVWRDSEWPYEYGHSFALTSVTFDSETGRIADADIEINSATSTFSHFESSRVGNTDNVDLKNALTHEVGHLVGLDHVADADATMFASAAPGEIKKRTLHEDDIEGLCEVYPADETRTSCDQPEDFVPDDATGRTEPSTCAISNQNAPMPYGFAFALLALLAARLSPLAPRPVSDRH